LLRSADDRQPGDLGQRGRSEELGDRPLQLLAQHHVPEAACAEALREAHQPVEE
jgi:hypothetical protein